MILVGTLSVPPSGSKVLSSGARMLSQAEETVDDSQDIHFVLLLLFMYRENTVQSNPWLWIKHS